MMSKNKMLLCTATSDNLLSTVWVMDIFCRTFAMIIVFVCWACSERLVTESICSYEYFVHH